MALDDTSLRHDPVNNAIEGEVTIKFEVVPTIWGPIIVWK